MGGLEKELGRKPLLNDDQIFNGHCYPKGHSVTNCRQYGTQNCQYTCDYALTQNKKRKSSSHSQ